MLLSPKIELPAAAARFSAHHIHNKENMSSENTTNHKCSQCEEQKPNGNLYQNEWFCNDCQPTIEFMCEVCKRVGDINNNDQFRGCCGMDCGIEYLCHECCVDTEEFCEVCPDCAKKLEEQKRQLQKDDNDEEEQAEKNSESEEE